MSTVTIAVDLAKNVFELAVAGRAGTVQQRKRLSRPQFERFWGTREPCRVVMETCASAHFWARFLMGRGFEVILLPPYFVRPYRRRNKTDRADCEALLEADRCAGIHPVAQALAHSRRPLSTRPSLTFTLSKAVVNSPAGSGSLRVNRRRVENDDSAGSANRVMPICACC